MSQGDSKVYQIAKKAAHLQEPEQVMALVIDHPTQCFLGEQKEEGTCPAFKEQTS